MTVRRKMALLGLTLAFFLGILGGSCFADSDEYWPMFNQDLWNTAVADPTLGGIVFPIELWSTITDNQIGSGSPIVADIDGDGTPDVGVPTAGFAGTGGVYVFDKDGNLAWKYATGDYGTYATPPVADIDGDGKLEMIFPSYAGKIVAIDDDGTEMWSLDKGSGGTRSVIADLTGDPALEVVAGASGKVWLLNASNGTELWSADYSFRGTAPAIVDIDGDGKTEIVFSNWANVAALNGEDGSLLWTAETAGSDQFQGTCSILRDINGDGRPDVAVGNRNPKALYVFSGADGTELWHYDVVGRCFSAAVADFNGDGFDDVVTTATKNDGVESYVYVLDVKNQTLLWQANIVGKKYYSTERSPSIADVNGDGVLDVLVAGLSQKLYALSGVDGSEIWSIATDDTSAGVPAIGDLDGDGMMEIVVSAGKYVQVFTGLDVTVVYVDDNWAGSADGTEVEPGKYFGGNAFATVEDGVAGVAGSTVNVAPGTYTPAAKIIIDKVGLLLVGPQAGVDPRPSAGTARIPGDPSTEAIIDGGGMSTILYIDADDVVIEGLEIRNGSGDLITSPSSSTQYRPVVRHNIIHDSSGDEGIQLKNVVDALIEYNHVYNTGGDGINIGYDSVGGTIQYNEVHDIYSPDAAIYVYGTPNVTIKGNLVYDVHNNDGIKLGSKNGADAGKPGGLIQQNTVHDTSQDGIAVYMSNVNVEGNEVYNSTSENGAIYLAWPITGITLTQNVVRDNTLDSGKWGNPAGILIGTAVDAANVVIHYNNITGNTPFGVTNLTGVDVDATLNWWGSAEGPTHASNPTGAGDSVSNNVIYSPWLGFDPDDDPAGTAGVQIAGGVLIIADNVGPEPTTPNDNTGYVNQAIWGSNDLPYIDTIKVRPGTYNASEPITDSVTMESTQQYAAELDGHLEVRDGGDNTTLQGFLIYPASWAVRVRNAENVTTTGNKIVGEGPGGADDGILYNPGPAGAAPGTITNNTVENIDFGIMVDWDNHAGQFVISGNTVDVARKGIGTGSLSGAQILNNIIANCTQMGIEIFKGDINEAHYNSIVGNTEGAWNAPGSADFDATLNWWGDAEGPTHATNPLGGGDSVSTNVVYSPWLGTDPDGNAGTAGVQITGGMLIIADDVGPEPTTPNGNTGYVNQAIWGSNDLPYTDTIEVHHGAYDASERITEGVNIISETGSASHTTLNGDMTLGSGGILIGEPLRGFTINGNMTVQDLVDASTIHINWNNLYGNVTNNGAGTLDAQYNFWGTQENTVIDGRTTGAVDYDPFLPLNADDSYNDIQAMLDAGLVSSIDNGIDHLWTMTDLGLDVDTYIQFQPLMGAGALAGMGGPGTSMGAGAGGTILNNEIAGGGGAFLGVTIDAIYTQGETIEGAFVLTDPLTGAFITDAVVTLSVMQVNPDGSTAVVHWGLISYDEGSGEYTFNFDTSGLAPGVYDLVIQTDDGQSFQLRVEIAEP